MEKKSAGTLSVFILLALIQACVAVEIQPSKNPAVAGDTLTLSLSPSTNMKSGSWALGESSIVTWQGNSPAVFSNYTGRASVNILTGALTLSSITVADSGVYVVEGNEPQLRATASIAVFVAVSNVTLDTSQTDLLEFHSSHVMKCSVSSGSSLSFLWLNGSSEVSAGGRVQLADGNSTLTIVNITRHDRGPFRCHASNPVSNATSEPVDFTIIYGPDNMALTVNGSLSVGSNVNMFCSVQSNPPAQIQWAFRGESVNRTGPLLELHNVTEEHSGPYSCWAFNNHTKTNGSVTANITITKSPHSGSRQQAVSVWLFSLLLLAGPFFTLPGVGGFSPWMTLMQ